MLQDFSLSKHENKRDQTESEKHISRLSTSEVAETSSCQQED